MAKTKKLGSAYPSTVSSKLLRQVYKKTAVFHGLATLGLGMLKRESTLYAQMSHGTDDTSLLEHRILLGLVTEMIEKLCKEDLDAVPGGKKFFQAESQRVQDSIVDKLIDKCDNMSTRLEARGPEAPDVAEKFLSSVLSMPTTESGDCESESVSSTTEPGKDCTMSKRSDLQSIDNEDMPTEVDDSQSCDIERSTLRKKVARNSGRQEAHVDLWK
ncbi:hypothetical protein G7Y79_00006g018990 [Physcia stellaris]|nr:hypothetical protein G7Y79_00006g018990 [Physcia stellaris]